MTKLLTLVFIIALVGVGVATYQVLVENGTLPPSGLYSPPNVPSGPSSQYGTDTSNVPYAAAPRPDNSNLPMGAVPDVGSTPNPTVYPHVDCRTQLMSFESEMRSAYDAYMQNGSTWNYDNWVYAKQRYDNAIATCSGR